MQDPAVSFHVESITDVAITENGKQSGMTIESGLDVAGDDYAGTVTMRTAGIDDQTVEVVRAGGREFIRTAPGRWIGVPASPSSAPANRFRDLDTGDLTFLGMTDEGLFEFDIRVWTGEVPTDFPVDWESVDVETAFALGDHRTRVAVDGEGRPHRLTVEFAISLLSTGLPGEATTMEEYSRVGEPVQIEPPEL